MTRKGIIDARDESLAFQERDADPSVFHGIPVIVDCTEVDPPDTTEVVRYVARYSMRLAKKWKCGPLAIVVNSDIEYGMARMYQELTEWGHADTEIFRSAQEALDWLNSHIS